MITDSGKVIRIPVGDIRIAGRATQGVTLFQTADDETVMSVAHLSADEDAGVDAEGRDPDTDGAEQNAPVSDIVESDVGTTDD
jgi:DNA gyrase subunit A